MAFTEFWCQTTGSNLNAGSTTDNAAIITATNGAYTQGAGAGGGTSDLFAAASGTPFSGASAGMWISIYNDGASVTTYIAPITAVNGGGASVDVESARSMGTRPTNAASGKTGKVGGALAGPVGTVAIPFGLASAAARNTNGDPIMVNFLSGTSYTPTAAMTHGNNGPIFWQGYRSLLTSVTAEADDDLFTKTAHGISTGDRVVFQSGTGFTGITAGRRYWAIRISADTFKLAETWWQAWLEIPINITVDGTSGTFKVLDLAKIFGDSASPTAPFVMLTITGTGNFWDALWFDDNGGTTAGQSVGTNCMVDLTGTGNRFEFCRFTNAYRSGLRMAAGGSHTNHSDFYGNNRDDASAHGAILATEECEIFHNSFYNSTFGTDSAGIVISADNTENVSVHGNIFYNHGAECVSLTGNHNSTRVSGNLFHTCVNGVRFAGAITTASNLIIENNIFWGCSGTGVTNNNSGHNAGPIIRNNAFGNNGTNINSNINPSFISGVIPLTVDPCVAAATGDFRLNATAGGGAACRAAGFGAFIIDTAVLADGASTQSSLDLGPVQHADSGSGSCGIETISGVPIASINEVA